MLPRQDLPTLSPSASCIMPLSGWLRAVAALWKRGEEAFTLASKVAVGVTAASLATSSRAQAQTHSYEPPPLRPYSAAPSDTVRRYGEKFILTSADSVVIRADTTWLPRRSSGVKSLMGESTAPSIRGARPRSGASSTAPGTSTTPSAPRSTGGGHYSHSSHSSHSSHRSGGWV